MASMFTAYLGGMGTVVAALAAGFCGGVWLAEAPATKEPSAAFAGRFSRPQLELANQAHAPAPVAAAAAVANPRASRVIEARALSEQLHKPVETKSEPPQELGEPAGSAVTGDWVRHRADNARREELRIKTEGRKKIAENKKRRASARAKNQKRDRDGSVDYYEPRYEVESRVGLFRSRSGFGFFGD